MFGIFRNPILAREMKDGVYVFDEPIKGKLIESGIKIMVEGIYYWKNWKCYLFQADDNIEREKEWEEVDGLKTWSVKLNRKIKMVSK